MDFLEAIAERERRGGANITVTSISNDNVGAASPVAPVGTRPYRLLSQAINETFSRRVRGCTYFSASQCFAHMCAYRSSGTFWPSSWSWELFIDLRTCFDFRTCEHCHPDADGLMQLSGRLLRLYSHLDYESVCARAPPIPPSPSALTPHSPLPCPLQRKTCMQYLLHAPSFL